MCLLISEGGGGYPLWGTKQGGFAGKWDLFALAVYKRVGKPVILQVVSQHTPFSKTDGN